MPHPVEEKIIHLIQRKDKAFVSLVYDRYADNLYGVIKTMVGDEAAAQDVLQESFLKIWRKADQYDPKKARLFTWLLTICRNTAIDRLRVMQKRAGREIQIDDPVVNNMGISGFNPQHIGIKDLLKGLDLNQQEVFEALFFKGMTQKEASEALEIPLGTVKTRLKIGLRELRKVFGEDAALILLAIILIQ